MNQQENKKCIGRESNPGLAESREVLDAQLRGYEVLLMATANFTTKPPMLG
jgi:hypothetical protein